MHKIGICMIDVNTILNLKDAFSDAIPKLHANSHVLERKGDGRCNYLEYL